MPGLLQWRCGGKCPKFTCVRTPLLDGGVDRRLVPGRQRHEDQGDTVYGLALETVSTQAVRGTQTRGLEQGQQ